MWSADKLFFCRSSSSPDYPSTPRESSIRPERCKHGTSKTATLVPQRNSLCFFPIPRPSPVENGSQHIPDECSPTASQAGLTRDAHLRSASSMYPSCRSRFCRSKQDPAPRQHHLAAPWGPCCPAARRRGRSPRSRPARTQTQPVRPGTRTSLLYACATRQVDGILKNDAKHLPSRYTHLGRYTHRLSLSRWQLLPELSDRLNL